MASLIVKRVQGVGTYHHKLDRRWIVRKISVVPIML